MNHGNEIGPAVAIVQGVVSRMATEGSDKLLHGPTARHDADEHRVSHG